MRKKKRVLVLFQIVGSFLLMISLVGCSGKLFTYKGLWVGENDRISLSLKDAETYKGNWQTRDIYIEYTSQQEAQHLRIFGVVKLKRYLTTGFNTLDYFALNIYTLDADGIVLDSKVIRNFGYRRYLDELGKMTFDSQLKLSADAAAISFGYRGRVTDGGGHGSSDQIDWNFWKVPGHAPSE